MILVVMGVAGSGKSTLGRALADELGWEFIEGDDYHPPESIEKMRTGRPLDDRDRTPWLERLHGLLAARAAAGADAVLACSALKARYRERLGRGLADLHYVFLDGEAGVIHARLKARRHHFMLHGMLESQVATLEPPEDAVRVPIEAATNEQVRRVRDTLSL